MDSLLLLTVALPFAAALLTLLMAPLTERRVFYSATATGALGVALVLAAPLVGQVSQGQTPTAQIPWLPSLGIAFAFRMDGLGALFTVLILGIGVLIATYAHGYLHHDDPPARFFSSLLLFAGAMVGVVLADDLIALCVFWELTSISSFLLIGYWYERERARYGAFQALVVTALGGLALLAGVLMLGLVAGSFQWSEVLQRAEVVKASQWFTPALMLILLGAFTKSAQFPFHFWLPNAMEAPTPVSAYLHSATMVKAGVFLLAKMHPLFHEHPLWFPIVGTVGLVTMVWAGYVALMQRDMKALLAYSTVSQLGFMTALLGLGTEDAAAAAVFVLLAHATFKAALFLSAGIAEHAAHTRDLERLGGLAKVMPTLATFATFAVAASAGVPPFNGYLSKETAFEAAVHFAEHGAYLVPLLLTVASIFTVAYSVRFAWEVFYKPKPPETHLDLKQPPALLPPVVVLGSLCLLMGLFPSVFVAPLLKPATLSVAGIDLKVKLWHGFGTPLLMSAVALGLGALAFALRQPLMTFHQRLPLWNGDRSYDAITFGLLSGAEMLTNFLQSGRLRLYLWWIAAWVLGSVAVALSQGRWFSLPRLTPIPIATVVLGAVLILAAILVVVYHTNRLLAILSLSVVGVMVIVHFIWLSAPDLALTQLVVEVASLLLFLLILAFLPRQVRDEEPPRWKGMDALLALAVGAGVTVFLLAILAQPFDPTVRNYYFATAKELAGGLNVVNVIVVDYRGYDTLGEITVMGIAGLGLYALLRLRRRVPTPALQPTAVEFGIGNPSPKPSPQSLIPSPLLMSIARIVLLPGMLVALYLFWRGHNAPGGGFIAGLVVAGLIALQYIAFGEDRVRRAFRVNYRALIGLGWFSALFTGAGAFLLGFPFLTSGYRFFHLPLLGEIEIPTAMFFDLGVLFVVSGTVLMAFSLLGKAYRL